MPRGGGWSTLDKLGVFGGGTLWFVRAWFRVERMPDVCEIGNSEAPREFQSEPDLWYYRARYYDASPGRFLSEDRLRFKSGDLNFYAYVGHNPTNLADPLGLCKV